MSSSSVEPGALDIAVVGSINRDLTVRVPRHPVPGETILGTEHFTGAGGKGANQAAAAARLGRTVAMIGRVGDDEAGCVLRESLQREGVETTRVAIDAGSETGIAIITLSEDGENAIVVSPGANGRVGVEDVESASGELANATVTLMQLEIPLDAVTATLRLAKGLRILNPAPARDLPPALLECVDILVPNRTELALLTGCTEATTLDEATRQIARLRGPRTVVVTLGADGALIGHDGTMTHIDAPTIQPVDTTGAGDSFCGALADAIARGEDMASAVRWAVHAGAVTATRPGALPSLPSPDEVRELMNGVDA